MPRVIAKKYNGDAAIEARFSGVKKILEQLVQGPERLRVGIQPEGKMPIWEGTEILDSADKKVGYISSGGYGLHSDSVYF